MKILESIEREVDELSDDACRKWLKRYKQAMFLIRGKLYNKNYGMVECFDENGKDVEKTNRINISIEAKAEISQEIAKIMEEYKVNYTGDILGTCNSAFENMEQWKEYFEDRKSEKIAGLNDADAKRTK